MFYFRNSEQIQDCVGCSSGKYTTAGDIYCSRQLDHLMINWHLKAKMFLSRLQTLDSSFNTYLFGPLKGQKQENEIENTCSYNDYEIFLFDRVYFQLHSEYRSTYRWHEYTPKHSQVVRTAQPQPQPLQPTITGKQNNYWQGRLRLLLKRLMTW